MPRFLAVYTMKPESLAAWRALPKAEQDRRDGIGLKQWADWDAVNADSLLGDSGMVGKTLRVTRDGVAEATNDICGYIVVRADTIEDAARMFETHPHITTFPGDTVDIMPLVTGPQD